MIDIDTLSKKVKKVDSWNGNGNQNGYGTPEDVTKAWGYDENGKLLFSTEYDKEGNFVLSLFEGKSGEILKTEDLRSDDLENPMLPLKHRQRVEKAKYFVDELKKQENKKEPQKYPSLNELLSDGINVKLSDKSRLSFAKDIENIQISKDKDGVLHMSGTSEDGQQRVDFSFKDGIAQLELINGKTSRSYNNKLGGNWTWRDLTSPTGTRYLDGEGEAYAKELATVMDKFKVQYKNRLQNLNPTNNKLSRSTSRL